MQQIEDAIRKGGQANLIDLNTFPFLSKSSFPNLCLVFPNPLFGPTQKEKADKSNYFLFEFRV